MLPDVLKGKAAMHWNRARPHHRGEIQQRFKHDFLRTSIKSIAESWEGVVGESNSIFFLNFFWFFLLYFSILYGRDWTGTGCSDIYSQFLSTCTPLVWHGQALSFKLRSSQSSLIWLIDPTEDVSKISRNVDIKIWILRSVYMKTWNLLYFFLCFASHKHASLCSQQSKLIKWWNI